MFFVLIGAILIWGASYYYTKTEIVPGYGGEYTEGVVGQPQHINPIISQSNGSDEDLVQLIFSGILKYDGQGKLINDLAENYEISDDKTLYTVRLKKNIFWHDGQPLTASDIFFTINLLEDPSFKSPLRANWQGIETTVVNDHTLTFKIQTRYAGFLNNLTFGVLPKHIWESISPEKFSLTDLNLEPIGTGPYKYSAIQKDSNGNIISYKLTANPNYFDGKPYLSKLTFNFYSNDDAVLKAYNSKEIMGINSISPQKISAIKLEQSTLTHKFDVPRYFAVFFNQTKNISLADDKVRSALAYATDRQEIIDKVLNKNGRAVYSPILKDMPGYTENLDNHSFDLEKADKILEDAGWKKNDDGMRIKNGTSLQFTLITTDWPELIQTAEVLKEQWSKVGARTTVDILTISDIQQNYIRPREYDALLSGQSLGADPDPFSFWHSLQKKDPGLNLSLFGNSATDKLIDEGRIEFDPQKRAEIYIDFQKQLLSEMPAVFLYSPQYIYPVNKKVRNINIRNLISPARRFSDINHWYIKNKRIWK